MVQKRRTLSHEEEKEEKERDFYDHNLSDFSTLETVLFEVINILEKSKIPYALMGGLAVKSLGRPRVTHDIDFFVRPEDAHQVLDVLESYGFKTLKRDPHWLFKAWKKDILIDVIFKSSGDIYFDEDIQSHVRKISYKNHFVNIVSPEDILVIKSAVNQEDTPHHWYDALAIVKQVEIDWDYLLKRARHAPRRVLSLLIYAQSNDIAVPHNIIQKLFSYIYERTDFLKEDIIHPYRAGNEVQMPPTSEDGVSSPIYTKGRIMEALTMDQRVPEHDIKLIVSNNSIIARGEVFTTAQMEALEEVIKEIAPEYEFQNFVNVRIIKGPEGSEAIR